MTVTRNAYAGAALKATITADLTTASTSITIDSATGWPSGAQFPCVIDPSRAGEEKVLVTRSGTTLTCVGGVSGRGYDGTAAAAHSTGAEIYPCITAQEMDDANRLVSTPTTKGDLIGADASGNPTRIAVPANTGFLQADSAQTSGWAALLPAAISLPWTAWTPDYTFGGLARVPTGVSGNYVRWGSIILATFQWTPAATESGSIVEMQGLPVAIGASTPNVAFPCRNGNGTDQCLLVSGTTTAIFRQWNTVTPSALNTAQAMIGWVLYGTV